MVKLFSIFISTLVLVLCVTTRVTAQDASESAHGSEPQEFTTAKVTKVLQAGGEQGEKYQKLEVEFESGADSGKFGTIEKNRESAIGAERNFGPGDQLILTKIDKLDGTSEFIVADYNRVNSLLTLLVILIVVVIVVARWKGVRSLLSLALSFVILFGFVVPQIVKGADPVLVTVVGSFFILTTLLYFTHGLNMKTTAAVIGTTLSLIFTGVLSLLFVATARLTGLSEDALYVQTQIGNINVYGLLLSGIILGTVGVLDDLCIGQASAIWELHHTDSKLDRWHLFRKAMNIGTDHISASVNTLVMAYVGASLPLVLLVTQSKAPQTVIFSTETIATEIVRSIIGTVGLVFAVPITTLVAAYLVKRKAVT